MPASMRHVLLFLVTSANATTTSTESCPLTSLEEEGQCHHEEHQRMMTCTLYLAESSIPNAGLGIYTGVSIGANETIGVNDAAIPIHDIELHNDYNPIQWLLSDYTWAASKLGLELEAKRVTALAPGLGALANNHHALHNMAFSSFEGGTLLNRATDPGAGSITSYLSSHYATTSIQAGSELFHDYGESWGEKRRSKLGPIPQGQHYKEADTIVKCFYEFLSKASLSIHDNIAEIVWNELRRLHEGTPSSVASEITSKLGIANNASVLSLEEMMSNTSCIVNDVRTEAALTFSYSSLPEAANVGSARASLPHFKRSLSWLKQHGRCVDGLQVLQSSVEGAGRGAFASRNYGSGDIITTTPLLPLNRSILETYIFSVHHPGKQRKVASRKIGRQLLLNYCYGHRKSSSLVLCPYGPAVNMLNHDSARANARIVWSNFQDQSDWQGISAEEILTRGQSGLLFDIVATKAIHSGMEVLLDYGREWEEAWKIHLDSGTPSGGHEYTPASTMNDMENLAIQSPDNLDTWCRVTNLNTVTHPVNERTLAEKELIAEFGDLLRGGWVERRWNTDTPNETISRSSPGRPCKIISTGQSYAVSVKSRAFASDILVLVTGVPRSVLYYRNKPYTSDIHLPRVFRSPLGIPGEMFPEKWKD